MSYKDCSITIVALPNTEWVENALELASCTKDAIKRTYRMTMRAFELISLPYRILIHGCMLLLPEPLVQIRKIGGRGRWGSLAALVSVQHSDTRTEALQKDHP